MTRPIPLQTQATKYFVIRCSLDQSQRVLRCRRETPKKKDVPRIPRQIHARDASTVRRNMWKLCTCCYDRTDHVDVRGDGLQLCRICASQGGEYGILRFPATENDGREADALLKRLLEGLQNNPGHSEEQAHVLFSAHIVVSVLRSRYEEAVTSWLGLGDYRDSPLQYNIVQGMHMAAESIKKFESRFDCKVPLLQFGQAYPALFFTRLMSAEKENRYAGGWAFSFRGGLLEHLKHIINAPLFDFVMETLPNDNAEVEQTDNEEELRNDGAALHQEFAEGEVDHLRTLFHEPTDPGIIGLLAPLPQVDDHNKAQIDAQIGAQNGEAPANARQFMIDYDFVNLKNCEDIGHAEDIVAEEARRKVAARNGEAQNTLGSLDD